MWLILARDYEPPPPPAALPTWKPFWNTAPLSTLRTPRGIPP